MPRVQWQSIHCNLLGRTMTKPDRNRNRGFASRHPSERPIGLDECNQLGNMADEAQKNRKLPLAIEKEPLSIRPATEVEQSLLADIARLGGEDRLKGAEGAL